MKIKGAIFDMDGTLIDSLSFWGHFFRKLGTKYLGNPDFLPPREVEMNSRTMLLSDAVAYIREACDLPMATPEILQFTDDAVADFYKTIATVKDGARELLAHLRAEGITIVLASATSQPLIRLALTYHGLIDAFDAILSCVDVGAGKDKPDVYLAAARQMGLAPADICVFEDSLVALRTARAAGFHTVGIFDSHTGGQDEICAASDLAYVGEGESLTAALAGL